MPSRRLRTLMHDIRGSSLIEFALVMPVLLLLIMGVIEVMAILFVTALMEGGLREASRFGLTGYQPTAASREERIVEILNAQGIGLVTVTPENVTTLVYGSFDQIGMAEPFIDEPPYNGIYDPGEAFVDINGNGQWDADIGIAGVGGPGDVVVYRVVFEWSILTPILRPFIGQDGRIPLMASLAVRNEPYGGGGGLL